MSDFNLISAIGAFFYLFGLPLSLLVVILSALEAAAKHVFLPFLGVFLLCVAAMYFATRFASVGLITAASLATCLAVIILSTRTYTRFTVPILIAVIITSVLAIVGNISWMPLPDTVTDFGVFVFLLIGPAIIARLCLRVVKPTRTGV